MCVVHPVVALQHGRLTHYQIVTALVSVQTVIQSPALQEEVRTR